MDSRCSHRILTSPPCAPQQKSSFIRPHYIGLHFTVFCCGFIDFHSRLHSSGTICGILLDLTISHAVHCEMLFLSTHCKYELWEFYFQLQPESLTSSTRAVTHRMSFFVVVVCHITVSWAFQCKTPGEEQFAKYSNQLICHQQSSHSQSHWDQISPQFLSLIWTWTQASHRSESMFYYNSERLCCLLFPPKNNLDFLLKDKLKLSTLSSSHSGVLVPGGFGVRGTEGKILAISWARKQNKPFLGKRNSKLLCLINTALLHNAGFLINQIQTRHKSNLGLFKILLHIFIAVSMFVNQTTKVIASLKVSSALDCHVLLFNLTESQSVLFSF